MKFVSNKPLNTTLKVFFFRRHYNLHNKYILEVLLTNYLYMSDIQSEIKISELFHSTFEVFTFV